MLGVSVCTYISATPSLEAKTVDSTMKDRVAPLMVSLRPLVLLLDLVY